MIKNDRQYRITKAAARRFEDAMSMPVDETGDYDPTILDASTEAIASQLNDLRAQIAAYEDLKEGACEILEAESLVELPKTLIKARIVSASTSETWQNDLVSKSNRSSGTRLQTTQALA